MTREKSQGLPEKERKAEMLKKHIKLPAAHGVHHQQEYHTHCGQESLRHGRRVHNGQSFSEV